MRVEPRGTLVCIDNKVRTRIWERTIREVGEGTIWDTRNKKFLKEGISVYCSRE